MQEKIIDLKKSVYEICSIYPDVAEILSEIGFTDISKPGMLKSMGRFMTIPKGAIMKKISMNTIKETFVAKGYKLLE